jgi:FtsP/CotA-like multicopper oxidase with cupredoxin domain
MIRFPDAGIYWYHPHMSESEYQERGLFGSFIVTPDEKNRWQGEVDREVSLIFHDVLLAGDDKISPFDEKNGQYSLMGRYGNLLMTNWETDYTLQVKKGETVRMYLTNSSNARPYNIALDGVKLKKIGGDSGAYERETWTDSVIL